jgi:hypothetical protein
MKFGYEHEVDLLRSCVVELETDLAASRARVAELEAELATEVKCHYAAIGRIASLEAERDRLRLQLECRHAQWRTMDPKPRTCSECGLLMWDAGD